MKTNRSITFLFLVFAAASVIWCGCAGRNTASEQTAQVRYFRLASNQSENFVTNQACSRFCEMVKERSGGTIVIEPCFDGELGDEASVLEQCRFGGIDFARVSASAAAQYAPQLTALQMPYEYTSEEHLFRVLDGEIGQDVLSSFSEYDITGLTYFYAGYRCFFSAERALDSLGSMRGLRLRVAASPVMDSLVEQWGAEVVNLSGSDLAAALRSGAADGGEDNLPTYVDSGYYRLAPYWVYDRHIYNIDVLVASSASMDVLTEGERALIAACAAEAAEWQRPQWISAEVRAMMHASRNGCYMALLDDEETARFREAAQPVYELLTESQQEIVEAVGLLADPPGE